jgi:hypothetical protein
LVLKIFAVIWIIAGILSIIKTQQVLSNGDASSSAELYSLLLEIAATALGAAAIGFFAYVLDLLMAIEENTMPDQG